MESEDFQTNYNIPSVKKFLEDGYVIIPAENENGLHRIQDLVAEITAKYLSIRSPKDTVRFLNNIHKYIDSGKLNELRVTVSNELNVRKWFKPTYFNLVKSSLEQLVGNELAMQRRINLSIQFPNDDSSLLPVHADVWDGNSPFEVVVWLPLVDCFSSKSMYIMDPAKDRKFQRTMASKNFSNAEEVFSAIANDVKFIDISYSNVLIFSQTVMHGNRLNLENETRWSLNCRFKSLFSPYAEKQLGQFFEPISIKPATRIGLTYEAPGNFNEK